MFFRKLIMRSHINNTVALAALAEPLRRRVHEHAVSAAEGVNRDGAAAALGVPRSVAAFHLDKLAEVGLLEVDYRRPTGRGGPGAGRPAKWYRRAAGEISVSVPARHYDLAADVLAEAVERSSANSTSVAESVQDVAREHGRLLARRAATGVDDGRGGGDGVPCSGEPRRRLSELLVAIGYEPRAGEDALTLANCPFHALAERHRELVCSMNQALLAGVVEEYGLPSDAACLDPAPGRCCVTVTTGS